MSMLARSIVGSPDRIRSGMNALIAETGADELMIVSDVYDHASRLRSLEPIASVGRIASELYLFPSAQRPRFREFPLFAKGCL
jgi:hypothetical protein